MNVGVDIDQLDQPIKGLQNVLFFETFLARHLILLLEVVQSVYQIRGAWGWDGWEGGGGGGGGV